MTPPPQSTTGLFTLGVTDAPVDSASEVNVQFSGVEIKPANGNAILYTFDPRTIDLLSLQGGASELLLENIELEAGQYNWIRLQVNAERNTEDSYLVDENGNRTSLWVPSGSSSGLKLNNSFVVTSGGTSDFTIDFDLRKSITNPVGQSDYILKPRLRIVDNSEVGEISGTVDVDLIIDPNPDAEGDLADNVTTHNFSVSTQ